MPECDFDDFNVDENVGNVGPLGIHISIEIHIDEQLKKKMRTFINFII